MSNLLEYKIDLIAKALGVFETVTAVSVMRRQHTNDDGTTTDVIDYYPAWRGAYGKFKLIHEYMNHDWQKERFAKFAGLTVDQIPLYESDQSLIRKQARPHAKEIVLPNTIDLLVTCGSKEDETKKQILRFLARKPTSQPAPVKPVPQPKQESKRRPTDEVEAKKAYYNSLDQLGKDACKAKDLQSMAEMIARTAVFEGWSHPEPTLGATKKFLGDMAYPEGSSLDSAKKRVALANTLLNLGEKLCTIDSNWNVVNEAFMYYRNLYMRKVDSL